jgi:hypothetical protein
MNLSARHEPQTAPQQGSVALEERVASDLPLKATSIPATLAFDARELADWDISTWSEAYRTADPFPHVVIDGLFPPELLNAIVDEVRHGQAEPEKNIYGSFRKHRVSELAKMGPATRRFIEELHSAPFLRFMEELTGIDHLAPDPHLEGGGVHQIGVGGMLKIHTDFNWHRKLKLHRRLNVLIYLNPDWDEAWGGHLELWDKEMKACHVRTAPLFNRMVVFSTTDFSYHGHPEPLKSPDGVMRNSIALYYYSSERPAEEIAFRESTMTNYRERPGERFERDHVRRLLHLMELRVPFLRRIITAIRGR